MQSNLAFWTVLGRVVEGEKMQITDMGIMRLAIRTPLCFLIKFEGEMHFRVDLTSCKFMREDNLNTDIVPEDIFPSGTGPKVRVKVSGEGKSVGLRNNCFYNGNIVLLGKNFSQE